METGERKTGLGVIKRFGIPFDELRVLALVLHVAGKAELVFILVKALPGADAAGHLGVTTEAPFVVDLTVQGVTRRAIVRSGKLSVETAQRAGRLSRLEVLGFCPGKKQKSQNAGQRPLHHGTALSRRR